MIIALLALLVVLALWIRHTRNRRPPVPSVANAERLLAFFAQPERYAGQPIEQVFEHIGRVPPCDDWDWGRLVYEWTDQQLRLRIITQSGMVICAERLDPLDTSRFGSVLETFWARDETA